MIRQLTDSATGDICSPPRICASGEIMRTEKQIAPAGDATAALERRFGEKTARVGIIGLGYVGLPLALLFARRGFPTTGFDVDPAKVKKLRRGQTYIRHISEAAISEAIEKEHFQATDDFSAL